MDNLIYDRTQQDVDYVKNNQDSADFLKGAYNYTDLNRIEEWCEYLSKELTEHGYHVEYTKRDNPDNILKNGSLELSTQNWTIDQGNIATTKKGYTSITITQPSTLTRANNQLFEAISGENLENRQYIYVCAKVRGKSSNISYPRVYTSCRINGSITVVARNLQSIDGASGTGLNDENWHIMSGLFSTYNPQNGYYYEFFRADFGISVANLGDKMDIKDIYLINLTELFGRGNEPTKSWCDANLTNYRDWQMLQFPTMQELNRIKNNIQKIKQAYYSYTLVPENINNMTYEKANALEKILHEVNTLYENMKADFKFSGEIYSGEV